MQPFKILCLTLGLGAFSSAQADVIVRLKAVLITGTIAPI